MDKKLCYKVFNSSVELEDWQKNEDVNICSISPMVGTVTMNASGTINEQKADCGVTVGAFVVYWRN